MQDQVAQQRIQPQLDEANKIKPSKWWKAINKVWLDDRAGIHALFDGLGNRMGKLLRISIDNTAGGAAAGLGPVQAAHEKVLSGLNKEDYNTLSLMIVMERIKTLYEHSIKTNKADTLHPADIKGPEAIKWLEIYKERNLEHYTAMKKRVTDYSAVFRENLELLRKANLIDEDSYNNMIEVGDYSPRRYIKFIDPDDTYNSSERITTGSTQAILMDPAQLMKDYIIRIHDRIARNKANVVLYTYVSGVEDNTIAKLVTPENRPTNFKPIVAHLPNGEKAEMVFKDQGDDNSRVLTEEWHGRDPAINRELGKWVTWGSGTASLRATATGINPSFALPNLIRDVMFSFFRTREFHHFAPIGIFQMFGQMKSTFKEVWSLDDKATGWVDKFLAHGGGMEFMTTQGMLIGGKKAGRFAALHPVLKSMEKWAGFLGQRSELWVRVALMKQASENGKTMEEAAWIARSYLDFAQGGKAAKYADNFMPYLNVSMQSTRGIIETFKNEPTVATWKSIQFAAFFSSFMIGIMMKYPELYDDMDDTDKAKNVNLPMPFMNQVDANGKMRYAFAKLPMDQGQAAIANLLLLSFSRAMGILRDDFGIDSGIPERLFNLRSDIAMEAIKPIIPFYGQFPPLFKSLIGLTGNFDVHFMDKIWRGDDVKAGARKVRHGTNQTNALFVGIADLWNMATPGESGAPVNIRYAASQYLAPSNFFINAIDFFGQDIWDHLDASEKVEWSDKMQEVIAEASGKFPGFNRFWELTKGSSVEEAARAKEAAINKNTELVDDYQKLKHALNQFRREDFVDMSSQNIAAARKIAKESDPAVREKYARMVDSAIIVKKTAGNIDNPDTWWEIGHQKTPELKANVYHELYRSAEELDKLEMSQTLKKLKYIDTGKFRAELKRLRDTDAGN